MLATVLTAVAGTGWAQQPQDLEPILARVGARIEEFYKRVQSLICLEKVTAQPISTSLSADGFARVLEYDLGSSSPPSTTRTSPTRTSCASFGK